MKEPLQYLSGYHSFIRTPGISRDGGTLITLLPIVVDYRCSKTSVSKKTLNNYVVFRLKLISCVICTHNSVSFNIKGQDISSLINLPYT